MRISSSQLDCALGKDQPISFRPSKFIQSDAAIASEIICLLFMYFNDLFTFHTKVLSFLQVITDVEVLAERPQEEGEGRDRDGRGSGRGGRADPALQHGLAIWLFGRYKEKARFLSLCP